MAYTLIEFYRATPAWHALSAHERSAFFQRIGTGMQAFDAQTITPLTMGVIDPSLPHAAQADYFAVWRCANADALHQLVQGITASGWHDYFATLNAGGPHQDMPTHLQTLARA